MSKILTIGDCHVDDQQGLDRFALLNKFIRKQRPDYVVFMGDFLTLRCLSAWDKDKRKKLEGARYQAEIDAGNKALDVALRGVPKNTKLVFIEGNHEDRLTRYLDRDPTFDGFVSVRKDLHLDNRGFVFVPYREWYEIDGVDFTHIPFGKAKEVSGLNITKKVQDVTIRSTVFAHTHELHVSCCHKHKMEHLQQVLNVGCFFEKHEDYVHGHMTNYWKGVVMLETYKPGRFDISTYSIGQLRRTYG